MRFEFRCPECNSSHFGSGVPDGQSAQTCAPGDWIGTCHGYAGRRDASGAYVETACRFQWKRSDDWKHFVFRPTTEAQARELRALCRPLLVAVARAPDRRRT